ncbi:hypothetical protein QQF73_15980 [Marinobacter sp. M216]|uniref:CHAT domain-containing protein n=1 Tax=Marinobacter albus TaxID=3030833 RepID=A0ABT7HFI6_9GAMM|nr:hypothetical protein [Marinobacter sp. M216]MDK9559133.1 hypothetical protein [Marinobacter sp. M216]
MKAEAQYNKIVVIESLPEGEMKTGKSLFDDQLMHINARFPQLSAELVQVDNSEQFLNCLRKLTEEVIRDAIIPVLHIECHGSTDGLVMADGVVLSWAELKSELIKLNLATRLNLLVVVGACNGAYLIDTATQVDAAPFFAVVGSETELDAGTIKDAFGNFYSELFASQDGDKAIDAMNSKISNDDQKFRFLGARAFFSEAFKKYYQDYCRGKGKRKRIEYLTSRVLQNPNVARHGIKWARTQVKKVLSNPEDDFEFFRNRYFFVDQLPEILDRLPISYEEAIGQENA